MNSVRVGTSGWSYPTGRGAWNGIFYPQRGTRGFRASDELPYYAEHFDTVEVNSTFYRPPVAATTARWVAETPPGFEFSLKLHQRFTHAVSVGHRAPPPDRRHDRPTLPQPEPGDADQFKAGLDPIARSGKLGALLAQFPPSFHHGADSLAYIAQLLETFREYPMAVELRHRSWSDAATDTRELLGTFEAAWVQIDEPKFRLSIRQDLAPNIDRFHYLRLHGRNAAQWWSPEAAEDRYNYLYSPDELRPFADVVAAAGPAVRKTYLYLNNHFAAKAVVNATMLRHQLGRAVTGEYRQEMVDAYPELCAVVPPHDDDLFPARSRART
jgi:uncharacterized protein YecE (DUF72 family)